MSELTFGFTKNQIIEENRTTEDHILKIKEWIRPDTCPNLKDEQIVAFLISCSNNLDLTKNTIKAFYSLRQAAPEIFACRYLDDKLERYFDSVYCFPLPLRTEDNLVIVVLRLKDTDYQSFDSCLGCKLNVMTVEGIAQNYPPNGMIVLFDVFNVSLLHMSNIQLSILKVYLKYLQECMPVKLHEIHFLNSGIVFQTIFNWAKAFINPDRFQQIHFHRENLDIDDMKRLGITWDLLPKEYGGNLESFDFYQESSKKRLKELEPFFQVESEQWINKKFNDFSS